MRYCLCYLVIISRRVTNESGLNGKKKKANNQDYNDRNLGSKPSTKEDLMGWIVHLSRCFRLCVSFRFSPVMGKSRNINIVTREKATLAAGY